MDVDNHDDAARFHGRASIVFYGSKNEPQVQDLLREVVLEQLRSNPWPSDSDPEIALQYVSSTCLCMKVIDWKYEVAFHPPKLLLNSQLRDYTKYVVTIAKSIASLSLPGIHGTSMRIHFEYFGFEAFATPDGELLNIGRFGPDGRMS